MKSFDETWSSKIYLKIYFCACKNDSFWRHYFLKNIQGQKCRHRTLRFQIWYGSWNFCQIIFSLSLHHQEICANLFFIPYLDFKILGKCTLKSCLRYRERPAVRTVKLNPRNFSKELLFFFENCSIQKFPCKYVLLHYPGTLLNYRSFITLVTWVNPGV